MSVWKRATWIAAIAMMVMVLGILGYVVSGSSAVESWVGAQLLEIGAAYLGPQLRFERLTYQRPRTIVLDNLTLSSPDPANPGKSVVILSVKHARLELTEIPRRGQPIKFSEVILESLQIHAIAAKPGEAGVVGFSNLLKPTSGSDTQEAAPAKSPMKLSDFLLIRHIEIKDGTVSYDPRIASSPPIWLDGINARLEFAPAGTTSQPGLYTFATTISRKPAADLELQGDVDLDALTMQLAKLELSLDLQEKNAHFLPPELQRIIKSHEITGQLRVMASGKLPITSWRECTLQSRGELTEARVASGEHCLSVGSWIWEVDVAGGVAMIRKADAKLLGGEVHLRGTVPLDGAQAANLELNLDHLQIQQILRSPKPDELPPYAGDLAASIKFSAPLAQCTTQAAGGGTFSVRQGRIDNLPALGRILNSIGVLAKAMVGKRVGLTDTADGRFSFVGDGVRIDSFEATTAALAVRGNGTVGFDRRLELRLNAGPMERLQNSLGDIGKAWASLSDAMSGYRVSGTLDDPQVSLEVGGTH